jgi:hypothetical protein
MYIISDRRGIAREVFSRPPENSGWIGKTRDLRFEIRDDRRMAKRRWGKEDMNLAKARRR